MLGIGRKLAVAAASLLMPAISVGGVPLMAPRRPTRRLRTSRKRVMGALVNNRGTTVVASVVASIIIALNLFLLHQQFFG